MVKPVAILCAARNSVYHDIDGVDVYDAARDCRTFAGGMPVVAHPPCRSWSAFLRHQAKPSPGEKDLGPWCVEQVRRWGGVLEHPAHSRLWDACGLPKPGETARDGSWSMCVDQYWWGYAMRKRTWLLVSGVGPLDIPAVPFHLRASTKGDRQAFKHMSHRQRSASPRAFADWLVELARRAKAGVAIADQG